MRQIRKYQKDKGRILDSNKLLYHSMPIGCILALLLLSCSMINPAGLGTDDSENSNRVYAEEGISEQADSGISLTISGNLNETINADTKNVAYRAHTVKATASSIDSYSLSISYTDGSTSLKNSDANVSIGDVASSGVSGNSMQANTWGWGWSDSTSTNNSDITYRPMSTSQSIIKSDNSPVNNTANIEGKLAFAAKFPEGSAAGHYTANVLVSFAIEPKAVVTAKWSNGVDSGISTMQEMSTSICNNSSVPIDSQIQLADSRDGKIYWIAKLKDGHCWMSQNLAYDGSGTNSELSFPNGSNFPNDNISRYYNPGLIVYGPLASRTDVSEKSPSTDPNFTSAISGNVYDAHKLLGNYYNWLAATNETGTSSVTSGEASGSICPQNWSLPTNSDANAGSFSGLASAYGATSATEKKTAFFTTPLNFIYTNHDSDFGGARGWSSRYWTSTPASSSTNAYSLNIYDSDADTSSSVARYYSASVRCVAK